MWRMYINTHFVVFTINIHSFTVTQMVVYHQTVLEYLTTLPFPV